MKKLLLLFTLLCLSLASQAQEDANDAAERSRIAAERSKAEVDFRAQEKLCYRKFAVTECLNSAKARRREMLANLRRQELSLNDAQRKRKGAERLEDIDQRSLEKQQHEAEQRQKALAGQDDRQARAAQQAEGRAATEASSPARAADRQQQAARKEAQAEADRNRKAAEAEQNTMRYRQRQIDAEEHKASLDKRVAEQKNPPPKPLPVPP